MKIYVASSWRNEFQPTVVHLLRSMGYEVYDFKDADGFHWSEIDERWKDWNPIEYIQGLDHAAAWRGFNRDMHHLTGCDVCVYVMPCGVSASLEAGLAKGMGKKLIVYVPALKEPDLMVKMADLVTCEISDIIFYLGKLDEKEGC